MDASDESKNTPLEAASGLSIGSRHLAAPPIAPALYLVATPIGNLEDITLRALRILAAVDIIACEDSRVTRRLTEHYGIRTRFLPYHEHNAAQMRPKLLAALAQGSSVALVSDAGTPLISDPGFKLVRACAEAGHPVSALPGPSAVLAALSLAGLPTDRFLFDGFLPAKAAARRARLEELATIDASLVLFESGHRVEDSLADLAAIMGNREAAICREMTKLHEEVRRGKLADLAEEAGALETRGEFVLVIGPPTESPTMTVEALDHILRRELQSGSLKDAVARAVEHSGWARRDVYARALELKAHGDSATDEA
ncbi:MAG: 16S rRNA (cytidine(1402)-2'-O)-methyltransferase [Alphaproteobacteria bacterium]|nr:16S rRNA (cytidine(1402)-2'-O)-methyltransferase [Alphaproteobacteria bacterium]